MMVEVVVKNAFRYFGGDLAISKVDTIGLSFKVNVLVYFLQVVLVECL
jgi:hypothetical protein